MNVRERLHATCSFDKPDRPIRRETIGFFPETLARWYKEGLPDTVVDDVFTGPAHFGFDSMSWLPISPSPAYDPGFFPAFEERVLREEGNHIIKVDTDQGDPLHRSGGRPVSVRYLRAVGREDYIAKHK